MLRLLIVSLLSVAAHAGRANSALARAQQWMKAHGTDPANADQAGMNDLKSSDPNAFAIVQALLAKQQLGLLDPKHPSANFAGAHKHEEQSEEPSAVDVLRAAPTVESAGVPVMSAVSVAEPVRHTYSSSSMWNFKAHSKQEDDQLVASVMGDVVGSSNPYATPASTGSLISSSRSTVQSSALNGDMATFGFGGQHSMATAEAQEQQRPAPVTHQHHSPGLGGMPVLEWGSRYAGTASAEQPQAPPAPASMTQQTSSLASVAQPAPQAAPVPAAHEETLASNPYLTGIDFSSDISKKEKASMAQQKSNLRRKPTAVELANNPYLNGLNFPGVPDEQPQAQVEAPKPEASLSQKASYLDQIGFPMAPRRRVVEAPRPNQNEANPLTTFSWHGEEQAAAQQLAPAPVETTMMQKVEQGVEAAKISGSLTDWLHSSDESSKPVTAELQMAEPSNANVAPMPNANVDSMAMDKYNDWVKYSN